MKKESKWMQALRAESQRTSQRRLAKRLNMSPATVNLVLAGKYRHNTRRLQKAVRSLLIRHTRPERPIQLKQLDRKVHANLKRLVEAWGAEYVGVWLATPPQDVLAHVRSTSKASGQRFLERIAHLGLPSQPPLFPSQSERSNHANEDHT